MGLNEDWNKQVNNSRGTLCPKTKIYLRTVVLNQK